MLENTVFWLKEARREYVAFKPPQGIQAKAHVHCGPFRPICNLAPRYIADLIFCPTPSPSSPAAPAMPEVGSLLEPQAYGRQPWLVNECTVTFPLLSDRANIIGNCCHSYRTVESIHLQCRPRAMLPLLPSVTTCSQAPNYPDKTFRRLSHQSMPPVSFC